jgi:hypothetical protein
MTVRTTALAAVALLVLMSLPALATAPQSGVYLEVQSDSGGTSQLIKLSLAPDRMRFDTEQGISMINIGGEDGKMLMIQHPQKQYMEFTAEMMEQMAAMMGQMPQQQMEEEAEAMEPPTFTRTGNTKQVGEWSAYEVLVQHPDQEGDTTMWMSQDVDADFETLVQQVAASMSSFLDSPMMQMAGGPGGRGGGMNPLAEFQSQMASVDFPDGFPVQIITNSGGTQTTATLMAINQNASFGADTWQPPAGYTKMEMPFIR